MRHSQVSTACRRCRRRKTSWPPHRNVLYY